MHFTLAIIEKLAAKISFQLLNAVCTNFYGICIYLNLGVIWYYGFEKHSYFFIFFEGIFASLKERNMGNQRENRWSMLYIFRCFMEIRLQLMIKCIYICLWTFSKVCGVWWVCHKIHHTTKTAPNWRKFIMLNEKS